MSEAHVARYQGIDIRLNQTNQFTASFGGSELVAESYAELVKRIDAKQKVDAKASRQQLKLALINSADGVERNGRGIHANTRELLCEPPVKESRRGEWYVALDWVKLLIVRRVALSNQIDAITAAIRPAQVNTHLGYGRIANEEEMEQLLVGLQESYNKAQRAKQPDPAALEKLNA